MAQVVADQINKAMEIRQISFTWLIPWWDSKSLITLSNRETKEEHRVIPQRYWCTEEFWKPRSKARPIKNKVLQVSVRIFLPIFTDTQTTTSKIRNKSTNELSCSTVYTFENFLQYMRLGKTQVSIDFNGFNDTYYFCNM